MGTIAMFPRFMAMSSVCQVERREKCHSTCSTLPVMLKFRLDTPCLEGIFVFDFPCPSLLARLATSIRVM